MFKILFILVALLVGAAYASVLGTKGAMSAQGYGMFHQGVAPYVDIKSFQFANSGFASVPDTAALDFTTLMTMNCWVKATNSTGYGLFAKVNYGGSVSYGMGNNSGTNKFNVYVSSSGNFDKIYISSIVVYDGNWHNIGWTYNGTSSPGTLKLYVDGVLDTSPTMPNNTATTSLFHSTAPLMIAALESSGTPANKFTGKVDECSLWNAELSATDMTNIYHGGSPTNLSLSAKAANLVAWYKIGDGGDTITANGIIDSAGGHNMSPTNMVSGDIVLDAP